MFELLLRNIKSRLKDLREKRERKFRRGAFFVHRIYFGPTVIAYSRCETGSRTRVCEINFARVYFRLHEERYSLCEGKEKGIGNSRGKL